MMSESCGILFWNCRSFGRHYHDIEYLLEPKNGIKWASQQKVLAFCETHHMHENINAGGNRTHNRLRPVKEFIWHELSHRSNSGGLAILLHETIASSVPSLPSISKIDEDDSSDILWRILRPPNVEPFLFGMVYLKPGSPLSVIHSLCRSIRAAVNLNLPLLLAGDFNLRHGNWDPTTSAPSASANYLANFLDDNDLSVLNSVFIPGLFTRPSVLDYAAGSVIDLAITSNPHLIENMQIAEEAVHLLQSDHLPITLSVQLPPSSLPSSKCSLNSTRINWNIHKNRDLWRDELSLEISFQLKQLVFPFDQLKRFSNNISKMKAQQIVDSAVAILVMAIFIAGKNTIGIKRNRPVSKTWFGYPGVSIYHKKLRAALLRLHRSNCPQRYREYQEARRRWKSITARAIDHGWNELCKSVQTDPDSPLHWAAYKKSIPSNFAPLNSFCDGNNNPPANIKQSLENLTSAYVRQSVPPQAHPPIVDHDVNGILAMCENLSLQPDGSDGWEFTIEEVKKQCEQLNAKSAPGPDYIHPLFLKYGGNDLYRALAAVFNFSWRQAVVPLSWKQANVMSLYKGKGGRSQPSSYRPISITSMIIRTFEHLIHCRFSSQINGNLHPLQFGFRAQRSTTDAIAQILQHIRNHFSKGLSIPVAFLDLEKAFDRVWIDRLLILLFQIGVRGSAWRWCRSFLEKRQIRCIDRASSSSWHHLSYGVPQGSVLSPLFFAVFINEVAQVLRVQCPAVKMILYADDVALAPSFSPQTSRNEWKKQFQAALNIMSHWAAASRMTFSSKKSATVVFTPRTPNAGGPHPDNYSFSLSNFTLPVQSSFFYLGLWFQNDLKWKQQEQHCINRAKADSYLISRLIHPPAPPHFPAIRSLVLGYLRPRCMYAIEMWRPSPPCLRRLQSSLLRPLQRILLLPYDTHHLGTLVDSNCPSLKSFREQQLIRFINRAESLDSTHPTNLLFNQDDWNDVHIPHPHSNKQSKQMICLRSTFAEAKAVKKIWLQRPVIPDKCYISAPPLYSLPQPNDARNDHQDDIKDWGSNSLDSSSQNSFPAIDLNNHNSLRQQCMIRTHHEWRTDPKHRTNAPLLSIKHVPCRSHYMYLLKNPFVSLLAKARARRLFTQRRRNFINDTTTPFCTHNECNDQQRIDDIEHIVLHCPRHVHSRLRLLFQLSQLDHPPSFSLALILGHVSDIDRLTIKAKDHAVVILQFIEEFWNSISVERSNCLILRSLI